MKSAATAGVALSLLASACFIAEDPFEPTDGPDEKHILISPDPVAVVEGQSSNLMVSLDAAPGGVVDVEVSSADLARVSVNPTVLFFDDATYTVMQVVTVAALHDADVADNTTAVTASAQTYISATTMVIGSDDDTLTIVTNPTGTPPITVTEGGNMAVQVTLSAQPAGNVVITVARTGTEVNVSPGVTAFTPANYNQPQAVNIQGVVDADTTDDTDMVILSSTGLAPVMLPIEVIDAD